MRLINKKNIKFFVNDSDPLFWDNYENSSWENDLFNYLEKIKKKNLSTFIDIGASNGCISLYASQLFKNVISLEPYKFQCNVFQKNLLLNQSIQNIKILNCALGIRSGKIKFEENEMFSNSMFVTDKCGYEVTVKSLEEIINENLIDNFLIKIDIEGFEFNLLNDKNFINIISIYKPPIYLGCHFGVSSIFQYKIPKNKIFRKFMNLDKTILEYLSILKLMKYYKYYYINGIRVGKFFFLTKKFYRRDINLFLTNEKI